MVFVRSSGQLPVDIECVVQQSFHRTRPSRLVNLTNAAGTDLDNIMKKMNVRLDQVRCAGAHPHSWAFKPARVNPIKLAYDTCQPDGRPHSDQRL